MKKVLQFALTFLAAAIMLLALLGLSSALSPLLRAQNVNSRYDNILWTSSYVAGQTVLIPVPGATVTVCTYPANAVPCTNLATLYAGPTTLGGQANNPTTTDAQGNFGFWAAAGYYVYTVTNSLGQSAGPYAFTLGGSSGGGGGGALFPSTPGVVYSTSTTTAINATSAQLVSTLNSGPTSTLSPALIPLQPAAIPATSTVLKGSGTAGSAIPAIPGTDYLIPGALPNGTTATTQSPGDNTLNVATDAFVLANAITPPGGSTTQVQVNNSGAFAGYSGFTYSGSTLSVPALSVPSTTGGINWATSGTQNVGFSNPTTGILCLDLSTPGDCSGELVTGGTSQPFLILRGSTSGNITISGGTTPATLTYIWPQSIPTASNQPIVCATTGTCSFSPVPTGLFTFTSATSDAFAVTGAVAATACVFSPTNATAATNIATTYISSVTTDTVTITHVTGAVGGTVNIMCPIN